MAQLFLLRHAKSDWRDISVADHDRPLNERGHRAATMMGLFAKVRKIKPALVLCSTATRARMTLDAVMTAGGLDWPVQFEPSLYGASASEILRTVHHEAGEQPSVLLVGHNPGFHEAALLLTQEGAPDDLANLRTKYPTCSLCEIKFAGPDLSNIGPSTGELVQFVRPRDLS